MLSTQDDVKSPLEREHYSIHKVMQAIHWRSPRKMVKSGQKQQHSTSTSFSSMLWKLMGHLTMIL
jgi:hypothetical protein